LADRPEKQQQQQWQRWKATTKRENFSWTTLWKTRRKKKQQRLRGGLNGQMVKIFFRATDLVVVVVSAGGSVQCQLYLLVFTACYSTLSLCLFLLIFCDLCLDITKYYTFASSVSVTFLEWVYDFLRRVKNTVS